MAQEREKSDGVREGFLWEMANEALRIGSLPLSHFYL